MLLYFYHAILAQVLKCHNVEIFLAKKTSSNHSSRVQREHTERETESTTAVAFRFSREVRGARKEGRREGSVTFTRRETGQGSVGVHVTYCVLVWSHPITIIPFSVSKK